MRDLTKDMQVTFWSSPEVRVALTQLLTDATYSARILFRGDKIKLQVLINALILYVANMPKEGRMRAVAEGVARLEALLADEPAGSGPVEPHSYARPLGATELRLPPLPSAGVGEGAEGEDERPKPKRRPPRPK